MVIKAYNEQHPYLLFIDIEFDMRDLIQFAGLLFKRVDDDGTYQLMRSINQYVTSKVCYPFMEYTSITNTFLEENGIPLKDLVELINNDFLADVDIKDLEVISHGLRNDRLIMVDNGINLSNYVAEDGKVKPVDGYCTFNNAKRILGRDNCLKLNDLCNECGFYLTNAHNAANDVLGEVAVFTYLKKIEQQLSEVNE